MTLFRITKSEKRATDLLGMGAFKEGGRWNSPGTYMLYTSENSSLAFLENLVYFEQDNAPANLYIMSMNLKADSSLIFTLPMALYPKDWIEPLFPGYHDLIRINAVEKLKLDPRLIK